MALEPAKLSDFKLGAALGSGATARVFEATNVKTGHPVAIKMMDDGGAGPEMRERFAREALMLSGVTSRHVSQIIGFGFEKGQPFLVLEKLNGETLDAKLRRDGPVQPKVAVRWIEQLIVGIRDCHDAKIIHRDIKPSNIFLHQDHYDEVVKVIDFGVARLREITADEGSGGLTSANHLIGSMGYMAPEQFLNAKGVNYTADLYAIGVVVFRTMTGRLPFVSRSLQAVIKMKSEQSVPKISSMPNMPQNQMLDWFVQKTTARDPNERFQNAREMLDHWWNVMASFDEDQTTDIMRNMSRLEESARQQLAPLPPLPPPVPSLAPGSATPTREVVNIPSSNRSPSSALPRFDDDEIVVDTDDEPIDAHQEERTIMKRPEGLPPIAPGPLSSSLPLSSSADRTIQRQSPFEQPEPNEPHPTDDDPAPHTIRSIPGEETNVYIEGADPFDLPTKSDPNLRKLVERELALQKARKERG